MLCPKCKNRDTQVVDSREVHDGVRRRRECLDCKYRYTTYERIEAPQIVVVKKNGNQERFNPEKIRKGVVTACKNRPVSNLQIDQIVSEVSERVYQTGKEELSSQEVGDFVRDLLRKTDEVAYVRFVSVYQAFNTLDQFSQAIDKLPANPKETSHA
ncbi:MAG TPA: transcriptional regulator NrdR [Verrucomicrobiae bacterium]|nr:transcriptional regulator NrdR [Verrucomicrobiae bacterium]